MSFLDELNAIDVTPDQPAQPAPSGGGSFLNELNKLGIQPAQPQPLQDDWRRELDRLGPAPFAAPTTSAAAPSPSSSAPAPEDTEWSKLPSHILPDIAETAGDIGHAILHPIQTAENLADVGMGYLERSGIKPGTEHIPIANAFGQMLADRYGGLDNLKRYTINHPVQAAFDITTLLGGGGAMLRSAGMTGAADVAAQAARLTNPLTAAGVPLRMVGKGAAEAVGVASGVGSQPIEEAARAGYAGGETARMFRRNLAGKAPLDETVEQARGALDNLRSDASSKYNADMARLGLNNTTLSYTAIDQAMADTYNVGGFKNMRSSNPETIATWDSIAKQIADWRQLPPDYQTPAGFDALKRAISKSNATYGEPGVITNKVLNAIRGTITAAAPEYIGYMAAFERAQDLISDLRKTFSLPVIERRAAVDTSLRKLQSLLRDNVNTSYGYRRKLAEYLIDNGAPDLTAALAGQALRPWTARGLGKLGSQIGLEMGAALLGIHGLSGGALGLAGLAPFMSPHLMGLSAYGLGRAARFGQYGPAAFQFGRADQTGVQ
jgi:hypothetical protein